MLRLTARDVVRPNSSRMDLPHALGNLAHWQLVPADSNEQYHYQENPLHSLEVFSDWQCSSAARSDTLSTQRHCRSREVRAVDKGPFCLAVGLVRISRELNSMTTTEFGHPLRSSSAVGLLRLESRKLRRTCAGAIIPLQTGYRCVRAFVRTRWHTSHGF